MNSLDEPSNIPAPASVPLDYHESVGRTLTLGDDLAQLERLAQLGSVSFGEMVDALQSRASTSLLVILSFAFVFVPIPGVSTASSVLFFALAATSVLGTNLYLPNWIRRRSMSQANTQRALKIARRGWTRAERIVKTRLAFLTYGPFRWLVGLSLFTSIVAFALPIPIPFNNSPPAFCILLLSLGLLGRDGVLILFGHIANLVMWAVMFMAGNFMVNLLQRITDKLGWTSPAAGVIPTTQSALLHDWVTSAAQCFGLS